MDMPLEFRALLRQSAQNQAIRKNILKQIRNPTLNEAQHLKNPSSPLRQDTIFDITEQH